MYPFNFDDDFEDFYMQRPQQPGRPFQQPPMGQPGGPTQFPMGQPGAGQMPMAPPPSFTPQMPSTVTQQQFRGPGQPGFPGGRGIRRCLYRNTYIWLFNGNSFWFFPTFVVGNTVFGFRWRRSGWNYTTLNLNRVLYFQCY